MTSSVQATRSCQLQLEADGVEGSATEPGCPGRPMGEEEAPSTSDSRQPVDITSQTTTSALEKPAIVRLQESIDREKLRDTALHQTLQCYDLLATGPPCANRRQTG